MSTTWISRQLSMEEKRRCRLRVREQARHARNVQVTDLRVCGPFCPDTSVEKQDASRQERPFSQPSYQTSKYWYAKKIENAIARIQLVQRLSSQRRSSSLMPKFQRLSSLRRPEEHLHVLTAGPYFQARKRPKELLATSRL